MTNLPRPSPLPEEPSEWEVVQPPDGGRPFWLNTRTKEVTFDTPRAAESTKAGMQFLILELRRDVESLKRRVPETGIFDYVQGNRLIPFRQTYEVPPIVVFSCYGNANHAFVTLDKGAQITTTGFTVRMINHNGSWDNGRIFWCAIRQNV